MNTIARQRLFVVLTLIAWPLAAAPVLAQARAPATGASGLAPGEVLRLLDAYAVVQAQEMLSLDDAQYPRFVARYKDLLDVRRRHQLRRGQLLQGLSQLTKDTAATDEVLLQKLAELTDLEGTARQEVARALAGVDDVLAVRQRARFRVFEEQMERRKLDLMSRARQNARPPARRNSP